MRPDVIGAWLFVWVGASGLLVSSLVAINVVAEYRRLRRERFPRPAYLLRKRLEGWSRDLFSGNSRFEFPDRNARGLHGRTIWATWDVRWGPFGESLGLVEDVMDGQHGAALRLRLENPILVPSSSNCLEPVEFVQFEPTKHTNSKRYLRGAVRGVFRPWARYSPVSFGEDVLPLGSVVMYDDGAA